MEWPSEDTPSDSALFSPRAPLRKIIVVIDRELLKEAEKPEDNLDLKVLLTGLLEHPFVKLYRYADDGPPPDVQPKQLPEPLGRTQRKVYDGWAVLENTKAHDEVRAVVLSTEDGFTVSGVFGNAPDIAARDTDSGAYEELKPEVASEHRRLDALAAQVAAQGVGADLYITERPYLHEATWLADRGTTICRPEEGVAVLSLYLRAQNEFLVMNRFRFNRGLFFWVGSRDLLGEAWRWFAACVQHSTRGGDEQLEILAGSLIQRFDRALETRDAIHVASNRPQGNDAQASALSNLDVVLVLLMAALDVTARVAHRVLGLPPETEFGAGWQRRRRGAWLDQVRNRHAPLAALVEPGTDGDHTITILRLLRNSIHGAALQGIAVEAHGSPPENLVGLPQDQAVELLTAMDALGGASGWGVRPTLPGRTHVDPGVLVDRLFEAVIALLNALMAATPVELLAHVDLAPQDVRPPPESESNVWFAPWVRQSIRWQLGL